MATDTEFLLSLMIVLLLQRPIALTRLTLSNGVNAMNVSKSEAYEAMIFAGKQLSSQPDDCSTLAEAHCVNPINLQ